VKGVVPAMLVIAILISVGVLGVGLPVAYDTMEEVGMIDIPEDNPIASGMEKAGEAIKRVFSPDKESFDAKRYAEREQEYEKYKSTCSDINPWCIRYWFCVDKYTLERYCIICDKIPEGVQKPINCLVCQSEQDKSSCLTEFYHACSGKRVPEVCIPPEDRPIEIPELPEKPICTMLYDPVCCNGVTYPNACHAVAAGCKNYVKGPCETIELPKEPEFPWFPPHKPGQPSPIPQIS